jgi:hypothetical protein
VIIQVDSESIRLLEPDVMTDFCVEEDAKSGGVDLDLVLRKFGAGRYSGDHAWISVSWIRAEASVEAAPDWFLNFERMLEYARAHGWLSDDGKQIRGHVERRGR